MNEDKKDKVIYIWSIFAVKKAVDYVKNAIWLLDYAVRTNVFAKRSRFSLRRESVKSFVVEKTDLLMAYEMLLIALKPSVKFLSLRIQ